MVTAPIDLLKIRFQLETATRPEARTYRTIAQSIQQIFQQEGLNAFWKGNTAGIWLYGSFSAVQFWTFNRAKPHMSVGVAGGLAAMSATFLTYPFDLMRTRMALQGHQSDIYSSFTGTFARVLRIEGLKGFYKGIGPTLAQVIPYMGLSFYLHSRASESLAGLIDSKGTKDFLAGGIAGISSKTVMMPFDVVRKRLQIQGSTYEAYAVKALPKYSGLLDCVQRMWTYEGFFGFYRGLGIALVKSGPATATTFLVYGLLSRT